MIIVVIMSLLDDLKYHIVTLSLSSHFSLLQLVYYIGFGIAVVVVVMVSTVADVHGTVKVVSTLDDYVAIIVVQGIEMSPAVIPTEVGPAVMTDIIYIYIYKFFTLLSLQVYQSVVAK